MFSLPNSSSALTIACMPQNENGFKKLLGNELYELERALEDDGNYSFSLSVKRNFDKLPLQDIGVVKNKSEQVVFGASLKMHQTDYGFVVHVVGIPEQDINDYKFYISYSETKEQCPEVKSFYVSFGT